MVKCCWKEVVIVTIHDKLHEYHIRQGGIITEQAERLEKQGIVKNFQDVYPDLAAQISGESTSYVRGSVPLKLMALIYDKTIIYVPPLSKQMLEERFQLSYEDFIKLCQNGVVIPILGNVHEYRGDFYTPLFELNNAPASLWARGVALLDVFGMNDALDLARQKLPVEHMSRDPAVRAQWRKKLPGATEEEIHKSIVDDIAVMYADLCIFGHEHEANELAEFENMGQIYESLRIMNETATYPTLFGLDTQPTYHPQKLESSVAKLYIKPRYHLQPIPIPEDLEVLLQGIGINTDTMSTESIMKYRYDGMGKALRNTLESFSAYCDAAMRRQEAFHYDEVWKRAEAFQKQIKLAIGELTPGRYQAFDQFESNVTSTLKISGFGLGGLVGYMLDETPINILALSGFAGALAGGLWEFPKMRELKDWLVKTCISIKNPKYVVNLWESRKIASGK